MTMAVSGRSGHQSSFLSSFFPPGEAGRYSRATSFLLAFPLLILLVLGFFYPVGKMLISSLFDPDFTLQNYIKLFSEPIYLRVLFRTLRVAFLVSFCCIVVGFPVAYAMARLTSRWSIVVAALVLIPFWTSVLVRSYAWVIIFQRNGLVNDALMASGLIDQPLKLLYTEPAVIVAMTHVLLPFAIFPIFSSLKAISEDLPQAALNLGASKGQVITSILIPLSLPGVFAASLMTFILALGFYITPAIIGGPQTLMMATLIGQQATTLLNWEFAGALAMTLLVVTLGIALMFRKLLSYNRGFRHGQ